MREKLSIFVVILKYIAPIEEIDNARASHLAFLDENYKNGTFIASGPQVPRSGGIIIAQSVDKNTLKQLLAGDPFAVQKLATYQIIEFTPTKCNQDFKFTNK